MLESRLYAFPVLTQVAVLLAGEHCACSQLTGVSFLTPLGITGEFSPHQCDQEKRKS